MAGLDANIILQGQQTKSIDPLDTMTKVLTFKHLADQSALERMSYNDQMATRNAYANNTSVDPNGNVTFNRAGMLSDLAKTAPNLVPQVQQNLVKMDYETQNLQMEKMSKNLGMMGQLLGGVKDQPSYEQALNQAKGIGVDTSIFPAQYDPGIVQQAQAKALSAKDQIDTQIKQQEANIKEQDLALRRDQFQQGKQQEAFKDLMSHAESSRQLPDIKQAYSDRYNAQKVIDIVKSKDDPNKIDVNMVPVVAAEVAKIAQGGVPQSEELKIITPNDASNILARAKQFAKSEPQAGEQGAFLKAYQEYANLIKSHANQVIDANKKTLAGMYAPHVTAQDLQNFNQYMDKGPDASGAGQDPQIANYAKQYGLDYDHAQQILTARGYKASGQ